MSTTARTYRSSAVPHAQELHQDGPVRGLPAQRLASARSSASTGASNEVRAWTSVEAAAAFLGLPIRTLRRALDRHAQKGADGSVIAKVDGLTARKFGRLWRVWLDPGWLQPAAKK